MGRKKRFRSPADFFPHLLWLTTDEAGDPDNCTCKICCPEEADDKSGAAPASVERVSKAEQPPPTTPALSAATTPSTATATTNAALLSATRNTTADSPRRAPNQQNSPLPAPNHAPPQRTTSSSKLTPQSTSHQATPTPQPQPAAVIPLPSPRVLDQQIDLRYDGFLFRQAEMVWYNRGTAWGLGVISQRWKLPNDPAKAYYRIQPLSWPGETLPSETKCTTDLRPWLAWSVPPFTNQALNNLPGLSWDTADWHAIQHGQFGTGEIGVDGSILAAKAVDATYTTFALESRSEPTPGTIECRWNGIFLGAEKVWVGDTVRIKTPNTTDTHVLVIREIVERTQSSAFNGQAWRKLELVGDVFAHTEVRYNNVRQPTPSNFLKPNITARMAEDTRQRNPHTVGARGTAIYWNPVPDQQSARFGTKDVKGRWYEATLLLPLLEGLPAYQSKMKQGIIMEAGQMMNAKGDCNGAAVPDTRKPERRDALGKSVPADLIFVDGIDPPTLPPQQQQQMLQRQQQHSQHQRQQLQHPQQISGLHVTGGSMPIASAPAPHDPTFEFMDMDRMDTSHDAMSGFGGANHFY